MRRTSAPIWSTNSEAESGGKHDTSQAGMRANRNGEEADEDGRQPLVPGQARLSTTATVSWLGTDAEAMARTVCAKSPNSSTMSTWKKTVMNRMPVNTELPNMPVNTFFSARSTAQRSLVSQAEADESA